MAVLKTIGQGEVDIHTLLASQMELKSMIQLAQDDCCPIDPDAGESMGLRGTIASALYTHWSGRSSTISHHSSGREFGRGARRRTESGLEPQQAKKLRQVPLLSSHILVYTLDVVGNCPFLVPACSDRPCFKEP